VHWRNLGEVANECTSYNFRLFSIFMPKIFKVGGNFMMLWQNNFAWFFETRCRTNNRRLRWRCFDGVIHWNKLSQTLLRKQWLWCCACFATNYFNTVGSITRRLFRILLQQLPKMCLYKTCISQYDNGRDPNVCKYTNKTVHCQLTTLFDIWCRSLI